MTILFRTEVSIEPSTWKIDYGTPVFLIGSCFSDHIGGMLSKYKFPILQNPFGVLYNPVSISTVLNMVLDQHEVKKEELVYHDHLWHSFYFHGSFSNTSPEQVVEKCNRAISNSYSFLKKAKFLFVTFGTAWVFRYKDTNEIVSNCHKIPATSFERFRLTVTEIKDEWISILTKIHGINPDLKIIFTVSPIRHFKDGAHENQISKSTLLLAIDEIIKEYPVQQTGYFPSYELMNDELRDYRFYDSDMVHISETGIRFIFEKFKLTYFSDLTNTCFEQVQSIIQAKEHRIFNTDSHAIRKFSQSAISKIEKLIKNNPYINFQAEIEYFKNLEGLD